MLIVLSAPSVWGRGGGGCLEAGTPILTTSGSVAIETLAAGDIVLSVVQGRIAAGKVLAITKVEPEVYLEFKFAHGVLRVTEEHPLQTAPGVFRSAATLRAGETLQRHRDGRLETVVIDSIRRISATQAAFNLMVMPGGTYFANEIAVHNKGCFLPNTQILRANGESVPIGRIRPGDEVLAFKGNGEVVSASVREIIVHEVERYTVVTTSKVVLKATEEHPFYVGEGMFKTLESLKVGDAIYAHDGTGMRRQEITSLAKIVAPTKVYNLQTDQPHTFFANGVAVHNKGCFLPDTPILRSNGESVRISEVRAGEAILAFEPDGRPVAATVRKVLIHEADQYVVMTTSNVVVQATEEHPFYVGDGSFKTVGSLKVGDTIYAFDGAGLSKQTIRSLETVHARTKVYNLQTDQPHTFFASGIAVHNKGCFPAGTMIDTPAGRMPIESLSPGSPVIGIDADGAASTNVVKSLFATRSRLLVLTTDAGTLRTTTEHPIRMPGGGFRAAAELSAGESVCIYRQTTLETALVITVVQEEAEQTVFNLKVDGPHTFVADGFVVHNKGGGGFGSRSRSSSRVRISGSGSGSSDDSDTASFIAVLVMIGLFVVVLAICAKADGEGDLDYVFSRKAVETKTRKTMALLEFLARNDEMFAPERLRSHARVTFMKLQDCWEARSYAPMKDLLIPYLFNQHLKQIQGMIRNHEINRIEGVYAERVDLVHVRHTHKPENREFTVLITARAQDYYVDDRTGEFLRGDDEPAQFQEFWTFQLREGKWLLREIEQTQESDVLKDENFFEQMTDDGLKAIYDEANSTPSQESVGPWLGEKEEAKASRTERLLNFLVTTDKLWNREEMLKGARDTFMNVMLAQESGELNAETETALFPEAAENLRAKIRNQAQCGVTIEYRNLCVRKADLVLVRNHRVNSRDEFVVRISAHAQKIRKRNGRIAHQADDVSAFTAFWTFGRRENRWKLKEVLPEARGEQELERENVDEESSTEQIQWYYTKTRAN
ncbi:MAG: polymorphic toxin-type HINT domain-containing protein [Verrucomicrobiota bacterium]